MSDKKDQKLAAAPRDWTIQVDKYNRVLGSSGVRMDAENVQVIEKSAYDALKIKVYKLEQLSHDYDRALVDDRDRLAKRVEELDKRIDNLKGELSISYENLAAAKAEIERLTALDYAKEDQRRTDGLTQANQRIKDLERLCELQDKLLVCYRVGKQPGKWLDEMSPLREKLKGHTESSSS